MGNVKFLCIDECCRRAVEKALSLLPDPIELARERGYTLVFTSDRSVIEYTDSISAISGEKPRSLVEVPEDVIKAGDLILVYVNTTDVLHVLHALGHVYLSVNGFTMITFEGMGIDPAKNPEALVAFYVLYDACLDVLVDSYCLKKLRNVYMDYIKFSAERARTLRLSVATRATLPAAIYRGVMNAAEKMYGYMLGKPVDKTVREVVGLVYDRIDRIKDIHDIYDLFKEVYLKVVIPEVDKELKQFFGTPVVEADCRLEDPVNGIICITLRLEVVSPSIRKNP